MAHVDDPVTIRGLLTTPARWAVIGLSSNPLRAAVGVSLFLQRNLGIEIIPVSLKGDDVHGAKGYKTLAEIPGVIDVVDCL